MTHTELLAAIQEIIKDLYDFEFVGNIIIRDIKDEKTEEVIGREIGFEDHQYQPTWYSAIMNDCDLLAFLRKELRHAAFLYAKRYATVRNTETFKQNSFITNYAV